jgi:hypothetical protein
MDFYHTRVQNFVYPHELEIIKDTTEPDISASCMYIWLNIDLNEWMTITLYDT